MNNSKTALHVHWGLANKPWGMVRQDFSLVEKEVPDKQEGKANTHPTYWMRIGDANENSCLP